jgi:hypothetical protein
VAFKLERTLEDKVDTKVEDKVGVNAHYEAVMLKRHLTGSLWR